MVPELALANVEFNYEQRVDVKHSPMAMDERQRARCPICKRLRWVERVLEASKPKLRSPGGYMRNVSCQAGKDPEMTTRHAKLTAARMGINENQSIHYRIIARERHKSLCIHALRYSRCGISQRCCAYIMPISLRQLLKFLAID